MKRFLLLNGQCADRVMKTDDPLEVVFKKNLISKL